MCQHWTHTSKQLIETCLSDILWISQIGLFILVDTGIYIFGGTYVSICHVSSLSFLVILTSDGPSRILIFESLHMNMKAEQAVDLLCIAYDAFPGVTYTWSGITCAQNELLRDGSTCSFTPSESDDGKTVTCTAKNPRDTNLSRSATYKISIAGVWPN